MNPALSIIIMAFNETETISAAVREIHAAAGRTGRAFEILVVDDGSTDSTGARADELARDLPEVRVIRHPVNTGLGGVYRTGFTEARGDLVTFFPADGQFPGSIVERYVPAMDGVDLILGCVDPGRRGVVARFLSWGERTLYRLLLGMIPRFQGIMMVRSDLLRSLNLTSEGRGWAILMEMILRAHRAGARIKHIEISLRPRVAGVSKVNNLRTIISNLRQVLVLSRRIRLEDANLRTGRDQRKSFDR
jgi:glycosyltransferase involved in cell wall biosynthesis